MQIYIEAIYKILSKEVQNYKVPVVDLVKLQTNDPFKVLLATILSARTKDEVTVQASKRLFTKVNDFKDLNKLSEKEIEKLIYPVGFYKTKAKHLKQLPIVMEEKFKGIIPETVEELIELQGVGRKTANLVVAIAFEKPAICIDTHCHRIPQRIGWFISKTPFETEMKVRKLLPQNYWQSFNMIFVTFGQNICKPISPKCSICPIESYCQKIGVKISR